MAPLSRARRGVVIALCVLLALVLLALLPPLINVNRFSRKIASSISGAIGRPVHLDRVTMHVLPLPGLTLENFVVSEDPHFGAEPVIRANEVNATLRWSSLWRGKLEISTISLSEPSVNIVRAPDGRWNIENILMQASRVDAAPTEQKRAGPAPRFPYIEATDGRVNLKLGDEKTPFSLTAAEFALWLPNPQEWRVRIKAKPVRTDTNATDTGEFRAEATLHRAARASDVPVQMEMRWRDVPMGEASKVLLGYDTGWRGDAAVSLRMDGTLGDASLTSEVHLTDVRRADFVPPRLMEVDARCEARATGILHQLRGVRCSMPVDSAQPQKTGNQIQSAGTGTLAVTADVPDALHPKNADVRVSLAGVAPGYALDWLRLFSRRIPAAMHATGSLDGSFSHGPNTEETWAGEATCDCSLVLPQAGKPSVLPLRAAAVIDGDGTGGRALDVTVLPADRSRAMEGSLRGGTADLTVNEEGFVARLHANNPVDFLPALVMRFPPLEDGMPEQCAAQECVLTRRWNGPSQTWTLVAPQPASKRKRRR
ncbi:MAG: AsmA family protein [Acidobacteria bacterium]|nr:AsmA family protein [Acidobacteriota bacterium]